MGVAEVAGFEMASSPVEIERENGTLNTEPEPVINEPIKFGSHGDKPVELEAKTDVELEAKPHISEADIPKNAVDEWPANKQIHTFYFVKYRPYVDPKLKAKLDFTDKEGQKNHQARLLILEQLKTKRLDRAHVISQLKPLTSEDKQFRDALGKLRGTRGDGGVICSSEEELDALIRRLNYRIEHESISLIEEKQIIKDIKQLGQTREKVIANEALRTQIQESLGKKESTQDQVKLIGSDLDGVNKDQQTLRSKIKQLEKELKTIDNDSNSLLVELAAVSEKRDKAFDSLHQLRKQREDGNAYYYQNRRLLNDARYLASKMDVKALEELSHAEVEKFMSLWNNKAFREEYEKRILGSLDYRQLSRDGRMRNPDEKPLVVSEKPLMVQTEAVPKSNAKKPKEDTKPLPLVESKEVKLQDEEKENISETQKIFSTESKIDETKLKEMKLQEEKEKAKLALERKKKLAEKSAAKAAVKAQKEAEKKLKDQEKKAKKKAAASASAPDSDESIEAVSEVELEGTEMTLEALIPTAHKVGKENTVRSRNRSKGQDSVSKAILKRKKSTNYWIWAVSVALVFSILLALLCLYFPLN